MKQTEFSLVSQGPNFNVFHSGQQVCQLLCGLHPNKYGVLILSGNTIFSYSVDIGPGRSHNPQVIIDELLNAFEKTKTPHRVLLQGLVECIQYKNCYMMLCLNGISIMAMSLHPVEVPGGMTYTPKDADGKELPYSYYTYPIYEPAMVPELNITTLVHSMGWCANRY